MNWSTVNNADMRTSVIRRYGRVGITLVALCAVILLISVVALIIGNPAGALTGPIAVQVALVAAAVEIRQRRASAVRVDGLLILTVIEAVRGVIVPTLVQLFGQRPAVLRELGTPSDGAVVLLIASLFFASFLAVTFALDRVRRKASAPPAHVSDRTVTTAAYIAVGLGVIGLVLRFAMPSELINFLTLSGAPSRVPGGLLGLLASGLRPLLPLGLAVILFQRRREGIRVILPLSVVIVVTVYLALASYSLNRSAFIMPAVAFAIVCVTFGRARLTARAATLVAAALAVAFIAVGSLREAVKGMAPALADGDGPIATVVQTLLIYGQSPLQVAPVLAVAHPDRIWNLTTLWYSFLSPLPGAPTWVRDQSGASVYNAVLYSGKSETRDQIIPSWIEAYLSAGWLGPIILGIVLAALIHVLDRRNARATNLFSAYAYTITIVWLAQLSISSFAAVGQTLLFFCVPPLIIAATLGLIRARQRTQSLTT